MQSGIPPFDYAYGNGPFSVADAYGGGGCVLGPSGALLEQAQFALIAERRRWTGENTYVRPYLYPFHLYTHMDITPSGPYEPKADGSTLGNSLNPGAFIFVDYFYELRGAMDELFGDMADDSDYPSETLRASWLQALYPHSPSGFYDAPEGGGDYGNYLHRIPSEGGEIAMSPDVLGSSGVLYDIDFGEVMFNPYPQIGHYINTSAHGPGDGANAAFYITASPFFPAFQKTNGDLVDVTANDPVAVTSLCDTTQTALGRVRLDGYMLTSDSEYYLGKKSQVHDRVQDFTYHSAGIRQIGSSIEDMPFSRVFLTPTAQASGVYTIAVRNPHGVVANTTIESGIVSNWPPERLAWPAHNYENDSTLAFNAGYEVFNDAIWMTDQSPECSSWPHSATYASGLAIMSPYTGHKMWVRHAELVNDHKGHNWPTQIGLERISNDNIIRVSPEREALGTGDWDIKVHFLQYDDQLNFLSEISSDAFGSFTTHNITFVDMFYDGSYLYCTNSLSQGADIYKFDDTTFTYVDKYSVSVDDVLGLTDLRGCHTTVGNYFYSGTSGVSTPMSQSGIYPWWIDSHSADPSAQEHGVIGIGAMKNIDGSSIVGYKKYANIKDMFEVTGGTHIQNGIYVFMQWNNSTTDVKLYLLRIVEKTDYWEVVATYYIDNDLNTYYLQYEGLHMDI